MTGRGGVIRITQDTANEANGSGSTIRDYRLTGLAIFRGYGRYI